MMMKGVEDMIVETDAINMPVGHIQDPILAPTWLVLPLVLVLPLLLVPCLLISHPLDSLHLKHLLLGAPLLEAVR